MAVHTDADVETRCAHTPFTPLEMSPRMAVYGARDFLPSMLGMRGQSKANKLHLCSQLSLSKAEEGHWPVVGCSRVPREAAGPTVASQHPRASVSLSHDKGMLMLDHGRATASKGL